MSESEGGYDGDGAHGSRPSMAKCADPENGSVDGSTGGSTNEGSASDASSERNIPAAIERIVAECDAEHGQLARRAISAVPGDRIREEATREIRSSGGSYKARSVRAVLKAFLRWLQDKQDTQIVFRDPDGEEVSAPLEHAFDENYIAEKYGVIKDGERAFVHEAAEPHASMLTLSGSNKNEMGKARCPGDHLQDLKDSWHDHVRRELQRVMDGLGFERYDAEEPPERWWEYAVVVEPHKSGYAHMHVAVFTSHGVEAGEFAPVLSKHVEKCEMAGSEAHQIRPDDRTNSAVSTNAVDPSKEYSEELEDITNLGSYLAEYIGASGEDIWDRPVSELICFALLWSTESRRVQFSQGFHDLAGVGAKIRGEDVEGDPVGWELAGIREGEDGDLHDVHTGRVCKVCGFEETGWKGDTCPECGSDELQSTAADYMVEIRGVPGGDPPVVRD